MVKKRKTERETDWDAPLETTSSVSLDSSVVDYTTETVPKKLIKYWHQRHRLWSRFNEGIRMDYEGWFSVTPERVATHIAQRCQSNIVIDAFCGVGGNAIQFAFVCERVIAIDIDPVRLACAKHNAEIYGVADRIDFILGNFMQLAPRLHGDVVFLSPPWGGPEYLAEKTYDIQSMIPMDGNVLFHLARTITPNIAYFLPRNTSMDQLAMLAGPSGVCEVEQAHMRGKTKCIMAYYGELVDMSSDPGPEEGTLPS
ncbi:RNA cap guanine-N2 methyltransferase-domain-containing protein [Piptocephalis cylindrospora]|uniref:Trimethylguanosine synthase n=1 Tax=Piptocephalis cylindrospora TaxID=1907219 RepID=A0A4P9Y222_9FUNG|nr:RNA cap guanine-N2 methyltransferase-domain-containing protein [Piptocephalis cylindrospora]|eukprot:RKP12908.1 RNA cap guanine-N2 methyltransferase-domain-containing protein [Piptocephalis cylindrospora]